MLAILLELQGKKLCRAEDLATIFEITKRTVYRDIQALCEAGVPVVAIPGKGYSILEGYFLPPVNFTNDEAIMLLLGADFMAQNFDERYRNAAHSAGRKIEAVLSNRLKRDVQYLKSSMRFITMTPLEQSSLIELLKKLRRAILERKTVRFDYFKRYPSDGESKPMVRQVDPYALTYLSGNWLMGGHDHGRKELRTFRLSRMERLEVADTAFLRPKNFSLKQFGEDKGPFTIVKAHFSNEAARWVLESRPFYLAQHRKTATGLSVTFRVSEEEKIIPFLLSWGSHVKVISPESIRKRLTDEAEKIIVAHR